MLKRSRLSQIAAASRGQRYSDMRIKTFITSRKIDSNVSDQITRLFRLTPFFDRLRGN